MEIRRISVNRTSRAIELTWSHGCTFHYPFPWLRDNCQCNDCQCTDSKNGFQTRKFHTRNLDPMIEPAKTVVGEAQQLRVTWPDGHRGDYTPEWLYTRGFTTEARFQHMEVLDRNPHKYWGSEIKDNVPTFQFEEVQLLHCIAQTSGPGGENPLVDGFNLAKKMEKDYPSLYKILTTVPVYHSESGYEDYEFCIATKLPVFERDAYGELSQIHWTVHGRESRQNHLPLSMIQPLYEAFCKFDSLQRDQENCILLKLTPGDVLCWNNCRVLHGRTAYTLKEGEQRHLEGGYLNWDDVRSKRRVLEKQLKKKKLLW